MVFAGVAILGTHFCAIFGLGACLFFGLVIFSVCTGGFCSLILTDATTYLILVASFFSSSSFFFRISYESDTEVGHI
jgi:hypothetical protein